MKHILQSRGNVLFFILGSFFISNAIIAEFIGVKIFSLESTIGIDFLDIPFFGHNLRLDLTAGVLLWPLVFVFTDVINEYYGQKGVRFLSYLAAALISYGFVMIYLAIQLAPNEWWQNSGKTHNVPDMQSAFIMIFGQGMWIIVGSLVAFLFGQLLDAFIFYKIKSYLGSKHIWIRASVSNVVSQFIDSYLVLYIAFVLGSNWTMDQFIAIGTMNYIYKLILTVVFIPVLYSIHALIRGYLGKELATEMRQQALEEN